MNAELVKDPTLVAYCGLYCGACGARLKGRCPGCHENAKASWCKIRTCCREHGYASCADCTEFHDPNECVRFWNLLSRVLAFFYGSNRQAGIYKIRELGLDGFAAYMAEHRLITLPRR